ncbi:hypothetical protein HPB48_005689 [Haemaphysalis longicornis]|uniref:Reverse transcriptase domain-containing protein n=1 Tax=Haemaphysalis longicornis TaxID=44386 RepID=A0A9J6GSQ5_HAELO|nr:hypothetical protein HPB48_005689 [Haemaphysalis longicornis]
MEQLNSTTLGVTVGGAYMSALAFADDILLLSDSFEGIQALVRHTEDYFQNMDRLINPSKSQYFRLRVNHYTHGFHYDLPLLQFSTSSLQSITPNRPIKYLGLDFVVNKNSDVNPRKAACLLDLIASASLRPFQKLQCIRQLIIPADLYTTSNTLQVENEAFRHDKSIGIRVKELLHLPKSLPNSHLWLPSRSGGLGLLQLARAAQAVQFKSFCRLLRLNDLAVNFLFDEVLVKNHKRIASVFQVPEGVSESKEVDAALKIGVARWFQDIKNQYSNKDIILTKTKDNSHMPTLGFIPTVKFLSDGDRNKVLRLRTNRAPTRTLSNRHASDPAARSCRRCAERPETALHILKECESVSLDSQERHNFVARQVARICREKNPGGLVVEEKVYTSPGGVRLKPDTLLEVDERVVIVDVAITWDSNKGILKQKCREEVEKYSVLQTFFPGRVVSFRGMAFGARSMLCRETMQAGKEVGLLPRDMSWLSACVVRGSLITMQRFTRRVLGRGAPELTFIL